jgi:hypothetical protein
MTSGAWRKDGTRMSVGPAHVQVGAVVMLTWGLSMTTLTLRLLKVAERE